ncbi:MAG: ABC transporter ATP-binding protein [Blautia sp.]|nr:ABC transporter ATP-binding protein [Blautia sp.]
MAMLEVRDLNVYYGKIHALQGISIDVSEGEIVSLIGANGAGKTTLLTAIMHQLPYSGTVRFMGEDLTKTDVKDIVNLGMTMVPEGRKVFARTSVQDNLLLGSYVRRKDQTSVREDLEKVYSLFPRLEERKKQLAGSLSGGEQQMLAIGRALMSRPRLLLLDEPSMGLSPILVDTVFDTISHISKTGTTILLVEQNARKALKIAGRGYVIETGQLYLADTSENLLNDSRVKEAYLGG